MNENALSAEWGTIYHYMYCTVYVHIVHTAHKHPTPSVVYTAQNNVLVLFLSINRYFQAADVRALNREEEEGMHLNVPR